MQEKALSRPAGVRLSVPSGLTDKPLVYFYPHAVQELIHSFAQPRESLDEPSIDFSSGILLARYLMGKGFFEAKPEAAFSGFDFFVTPRHLRSQEDFIALATFVYGRPQKLREAMAFTGGSSPSTAMHIYPPHQELPRLLTGLHDFFGEDWSRINPIHVVAAVFYYALSIHPFSDGNGRWARHLAVAAAQKTGDVWLAITLLVFFARQEKHLISMWKQAETSGLDQYMGECVISHRRISHEFSRFASRVPIGDVMDILSGKCERRQAERLFCHLVASGSLSETKIAAILQCSHKKATGIICALQERIGPGCVKGNEGEFNFQDVIMALHGDVDKIALII